MTNYSSTAHSTATVTGGLASILQIPLGFAGAVGGSHLTGGSSSSGNGSSSSHNNKNEIELDKI